MTTGMKNHAKNLNHHLGLHLLETAWFRRKRLTHHTESTQRILEGKPAAKEKHHYPDPVEPHKIQTISHLFLFIKNYIL